jgi:hypothetical protein
MIDVTDICEDKPCTPIPGKTLNPELWCEGTRIGFRICGQPLLDHKQYFLKVTDFGEGVKRVRIMKIQDDEYARGVRASTLL